MKENDKTFCRAELERLSASELDQFLRAELDSEAPDREKVLTILAIMEGRDPTDRENRLDGAESAFGELRKDRSECVERITVQPKKKPKNGKWIGVVAAAAAVVIILSVCVPQTAGAQSIFDIIGRWTQDVFKFSDSEETEEPVQETYVFETDNEGLQQLYDAVAEQGVTEPIVPMWIPEGYELQEVKNFAKSKVPKIYASFVKGEKYIQITFEIHSSESANEYPKDDANVTIHESAGICYYIVPNEDMWKTVWTNGNVECGINTNDTKDVLYEILNSIQGRTRNEKSDSYFVCCDGSFDIACCAGQRGGKQCLFKPLFLLL